MQSRVISIGTLAAHPLWGERQQVRTGHMTTTLVRAGERRIVVDPGLPAAALAARLGERANLAPGQITDVFLTSFHPDGRRALAAFDAAVWWIHADERESVGVAMAQRLRAMSMREGVEDAGERDEELMAHLRQEIATLQRCKAAPDSFADRVSIFPLPGVSPGTCGLLLEDMRHTTLICGDAVATSEHLDEGRVLHAADLDKARTSLEEALEIADLLILGRDNMVVNPMKRPF